VDFISGLVLVVAAFAAGLFAGKFISPNAARIKALEDKIDEQKKQQQSYKDSVAEHFSKSANLFGDMTEKYRSLHEHLSSGANELCERRNLPRELSSSHVNILAVETPNVAANISTETQRQKNQTAYSAEDYMVDVTRSGFSHLDPKSQKINQQNRNTKSDDNIAEPVSDAAELNPVSKPEKTAQQNSPGAEIIDLESQRSEDAVQINTEQAKDYAIKEKGVINHNSLNRDENIDSK